MATPDSFVSKSKQIPSAAAGRKSAPRVLRLMRFAFSFLDKTLPALGGRWAYWLWFRTHRFAEPRREERYRLSATMIPFTQEGKPLAVYAWGEGPCIVLVHGWNGRATQMWGFIDPLVARGFRVVAFDMPAHGGSAGKKTDLYKMADALKAVAAAQGPLHGVVAHSLGVAALVMAVRDGLALEKSVCVSPPAQTEWMIAGYAQALALSPRLQQMLRTLFERDYGERVWQDTSAEANVDKLRVPALVIHDEDDNEVPCEHGKRIAAQWPGARLVLTQTLGHRRILRDTAVIEAAVGFLSEEGDGESELNFKKSAFGH